MNLRSTLLVIATLLLLLGLILGMRLTGEELNLWRPVIGAVAFVGVLALFHRIPDSWFNKVKDKLPFSRSKSRLVFMLGIPLLTPLAVLLLSLHFLVGFRSVVAMSLLSESAGLGDSEYLIPFLDSAKPQASQVHGLEGSRFKYLEYPDDGTRNAILNRSAFIACLRSDYGQSLEFIASGLKWYPGDKDLLAIRAIVAYEQSLYQQALEGFQQAGGAELRLPSSTRFQAAMLANQGLARWELGQTKLAHETLDRSIALFGKENATQEETLVLLNQGQLYADYWQLGIASTKTDTAESVAGRMEQGTEALTQRANAFRLRAAVALIREPLDAAREQVELAINAHLQAQALHYLAQDYEVKAAIEEQAGLYDQALDWLNQAARVYQQTKSTKEVAENKLKQAKVLLVQSKYPEAQALIESASRDFGGMGYKRGAGEASALEGELLRQRAVSADIVRHGPELVVSETRKALERYQKALEIFQDIGNVRGIADASNLLGLATIQLNKPSDQEDEAKALPDDAFEKAKEYFEQAAALYTQIGDKRGEANVYGNSGILYRTRLDYDSAITWLEKSLQIQREIGFRLGMARQLFNIGRLRCEQSQKEAGRTYLERAREQLAGIQGGQKEAAAVELYLTDLCR